MTSISKITKSIGKALRRFKSALLSTILHLITVCVFVAVFVAIRHYLPSGTQHSEIEGSVQLLAQVLAIVVGILLVGTTVNLSSYDGSETLNAIQNDLHIATDKFYEKIHSSGRRRHKLFRNQFRNFALSRPRIGLLQFFDPAAEKRESWFIYRPRWDGVWYMTHLTPFSNSSLSTGKFYQVQRLHEVTICAYSVLKAVSEFRKSGSAIIKTNNGTNGSKWFIEEFNKFLETSDLEVPDQLDLDQAKSVISLAVRSEYYMKEELDRQSENVNWIPHVKTTFQLKYCSYMTDFIHLVEKFQHLRLTNVLERYPQSIEYINKKAGDITLQKLLHTIRGMITKIRERAVMAHGATSYFNSIKRMSVLGIGTTLSVLILLLVGWPYLKLVATPDDFLFGFAVLYSAGIAALIESSWFLGRLLWKRRLVE